MIKKIALLICLVFLVSACGGAQTNGNGGQTERGIFSGNSEQQNTASTFIGGVAQVALAFEEDAPPTETYDDGSIFDVIVTAKNNGEYPIQANDIEFKLHGINPVDFGKTQEEFKKNADFELLPRRKDPTTGDIIEGEEATIYFTGLAYGGSSGKAVAGNVPFPISVEACYDYKTNVVTTMCVRDDILRPTGESVCTINSDRDFANTAAPVQIRNVKQAAQGSNAVALIFDVVESGSGNLFVHGSKCDTLDRQKANKVIVKIDTGIAGLTCEGLRDGKSEGTAFTGTADLGTSGLDKVRCVQQLNAETDYVQLVTAELSYAYQQAISTQITVRPSS